MGDHSTNPVSWLIATNVTSIAFAYVIGWHRGWAERGKR